MITFLEKRPKSLLRRFVNQVLLLLLGVTLMAPSPIHAGQILDAQITPLPGGGLQLTWPTCLRHCYRMEASPDLTNWLDCGLNVKGTGGPVSYGVSNTADEFFYRVRDLFMTLPSPDQQLCLIDGVCFAFTVDGLPPTLDKIRIFQRPYAASGPPAAWALIGCVQGFEVRRGVKYAAGSTVWLPTAQGTYEVKAEAVTDDGTILAAEQRRLFVIPNVLPTVTITGLLSNPLDPDQMERFNTTTSFGAPVRRVEFFDNGVSMGVDVGAPFGDIMDGGFEYPLLKGSPAGRHEFTAVAYDARGQAGPASAPFVVYKTTGNSRPVISTVPSGELSVIQGQSVNIPFTVSDPDGPNMVRTVWVYTADSYIGPKASVNIPSVGTVPSSVTLPTSASPTNVNYYPPGPHLFRLQAEDDTHLSYFKYVRVNITSAAGPGTNPATLAPALADPASVTLTNPVFTGPWGSSRQFTGGLASGLAMNSGLVLTTGLASLWNSGPGEYMRYDWHSPGDTAVGDRVTASFTHDAAVLEFDVVCLNGQLELDTQFASDEYTDGIQSLQNGFVLTVDGVLVSLLPDCSGTPSANTVHPYVEGDGDGPYPAINEHLYLSVPQDVTITDPVHSVAFNGLIAPLKVRALVAPGSTHHVRLSIADKNLVGSLTSAIFLRAGSLRSVVPHL